MAISYRTNGAWGSGIGTNLTAVQVDENFYTLHLRVLDIEENPPEAVGIDHFVIEGALLTIVMTDASEHGPFVLPMGQWRWTGEWAPSTTYFLGDLLTESGNLYFVRQQHISDLTFDPDLFTVDGAVYVLVLPRAIFLLELSFYEKDVIGEGEGIIWQFVASRDFTIPALFAAAQAYLRVATLENSITLPIFLNASVIGQISFLLGITTDVQGGQYGTYSSTSDDAIEVVAGDIIAIGQPYDADIAAAGLTVNIPATMEGES